MKFCPKCDVRLKKSAANSVLSCPSCGYSEGQESEIQINTSEEEHKSDFLVLDENEGKNLPFKNNEFDFVIASHVIEHAKPQYI